MSLKPPFTFTVHKFMAYLDFITPGLMIQMMFGVLTKELNFLPGTELI